MEASSAFAFPHKQMPHCSFGEAEHGAEKLAARLDNNLFFGLTAGFECRVCRELTLRQDNYVRDRCGLLEINSGGPACLFRNPLSQFWSILGCEPIAVTSAGLGLTLERRRLSS